MHRLKEDKNEVSSPQSYEPYDRTPACPLLIPPPRASPALIPSLLFFPTPTYTSSSYSWPWPSNLSLFG